MQAKLQKLILFFKPLSDQYNKAATSRYGKLIRMSSYHVYLLLFLPTWCAIWMADLSNNVVHKLFLCLLFALGAFLTRSAGCIINDIADIKFDAKVERTKNRPLITGEVKVQEAIILACIMLLLGLIILLILPNRVLYIAMIALVMIVFYPLSKRFTNLPQAVLGFTFNLGIIMAWLTVSTSGFFQLAILYIGFIFLTCAYDTIYACQDIEYDREAGIKSLPLLMQTRGINIKDAVWRMYRIAFTLIGLAGLSMNMGSSFYLSLVIMIYIIFNSLESCDIYMASSCNDHFKKISLVLIILFLGVCFGK